MALPDRINVSKTISPAQHAVIDYSAAGAFFALGMRYRDHNRAASNFAFLNGGLVLGMSMLTDYPGGLWRTISFKTHGTLDVLQAAFTAAGPLLFGFADSPEARTFYTQALAEAGVVASTDWAAA